MSRVETTSITIEAAGESETIELPADLIDRLSEPGDEVVDVVADVAVMAFTGRAHALVHHTEDEDEALDAAEQWMLEDFEDRFGVTYGEATGHSH